MALSEPPQFLAANGQVCMHSVPIMLFKLSVPGSAPAVSVWFAADVVGGLVTGLTCRFFPLAGLTFFTLNEAEDITEYEDVRLLVYPFSLRFVSWLLTWS